MRLKSSHSIRSRHMAAYFKRLHTTRDSHTVDRLFTSCVPSSLSISWLVLLRGVFSDSNDHRGQESPAHASPHQQGGVCRTARSRSLVGRGKLPRIVGCRRRTSKPPPDWSLYSNQPCSAPVYRLGTHTGYASQKRAAVQVTCAKYLIGCGCNTLNGSHSPFTSKINCWRLRMLRTQLRGNRKQTNNRSLNILTTSYKQKHIGKLDSHPLLKFI